MDNEAKKIADQIARDVMVHGLANRVSIAELYEQKTPGASIFEFKVPLYRADEFTGDTHVVGQNDLTHAQIRAFNLGLKCAAAICDAQALEGECPERAQYCADAIREQIIEEKGTPL